MIDEGAYWRTLHEEMGAERDRYRQVALDRTCERNDARAEADQLRARVQQLGEEGRRALHERDEARDERDEARDERDRYRIREAQQRVERIKAEGEARRLRAALEAVIAEPWLSGGPDACTIASAVLYPAPLE